MATPKLVKQNPVNPEFSAKAAYVYTSPAPVYAFNAKGEFILLYNMYTKGAVIGITSGHSALMSNGLTYYLLKLKTPYKGYNYAYVSLQAYRFSTAKAADEAAAKNDAQNLLDQILASDKALTTKVNTFNETLNRAEKLGVDVTKYRANCIKVANALTERQKAIASNPWIKITQKISGTDQTQNAIGIVPLVIWGVVAGAGLVIAGLTVYYFLKPEYDTSQLHSQYLSQNEAELRATLGDAKYEELKKNVDTEIKENASDAYSEGKGEGIFATVKPLLWMGLGFWAVSKFKNS